jgi:hypothetical protein
MVTPGLYSERGLLHPFIDYDVPPPWLNTLVDPMDEEGNVYSSPNPGLGYDITWDYINSNLVDRPSTRSPWALDRAVAHRPRETLRSARRTLPRVPLDP